MARSVAKDLQTALFLPKIKPYADALAAELSEWEKTTNHLLGIAAKGDAEVFLSDATLYIELFGILNVAWQWLRMGTVAEKLLLENSADADQAFYTSKIHTMQFFFHYELPKVKSLTTRLLDETVLTVFDEKVEILM